MIVGFVVIATALLKIGVLRNVADGFAVIAKAPTKTGADWNARVGFAVAASAAKYVFHP